jgi:hypothetical protein
MGKVSDSELRSLGENPRDIYSNKGCVVISETLGEKASQEETKNYIEFKHPIENGRLFYSPRNSFGIHRLSSGAAEEEKLSTDLEMIEDLKYSI